MVSDFEMLVQVRFGGKGRWTPTGSTCTFVPDAPVSVPEDDGSRFTAELTGTYWCTLDSVVLESGDLVRVKLSAMILERQREFKFRTSGTF
jgi:hypothetical protein